MATLRTIASFCSDTVSFTLGDCFCLLLRDKPHLCEWLKYLKLGRLF